MEFQITKSDLKPLRKGLYPKHKMSRIMFPMESMPTPIILSYLQ
jgi:hypothetical protein